MTAVHLGDGTEIGLHIHLHRRGIDRRMAVGPAAVGGIAYGGTFHRRCEFEAHLTAHLLHADDFRLRHAVVAVLMVEAGVLAPEPASETLPVADSIAAPSQFRHCKQTGEGKVFGILLRAVLVEQGQFLQHGTVDELVAPEASLHTQNGRCRRIVVDRHGIALLERDGRHPCGSLDFARCTAFGEVEIEVGGRCQNGLVAGLRGLDGIVHLMPDECHHRLAHLAAHDDFLPSHNGLALLLHHVRHHIGEIPLQVRNPGKTFALHHLLAERTFLPTVVDRLVATDVDIFRREEVGSLLQHIGKELIRSLLSHTEQVAADEMLARHLVLLARTRQPGVGHHCRKHVGRELDFGDYFYVTDGSIGNDFPDVVLRIVAAQPVLVLSSPGTHLGETGIFLDFQPPSRVINQMELQLVHLVHRHHVDVVLHKLLVVEVACHIKHHATPRMVGCIADFHLRHQPFHSLLQRGAMYGGGQQLEESLNSVEDATGIMATNRHTLAIDRQAVTLGFRHTGCVDLEHHIGTAFLLRRLPAESGGREQYLTQIAGLGLTGGIAGHRHASMEFQHPSMLLHTGGLGDDGDGLCHGTKAERQGNGKRRQT